MQGPADIFMGAEGEPKMKKRQAIMVGTVLLSFLPFQNCGQSFQVNQAGTNDIASNGSVDPGSGGDPTTTTLPPGVTTTTIPCLNSDVGSPSMELSTVSVAEVKSGRGNNPASGRVGSSALNVKYMASNAAPHCQQGATVQCNVVNKTVTAMDRNGNRTAVANNDLTCGRAPANAAPGQSIAITFGANDNDNDKQCFSGTVTFEVFLRSVADNNKSSTRQQFTVTYKNNCFPESLTSEAVDSYDQYGSAVAMDGDVMAVLSPGDDGPTNSNSAVGAVYIYRRSGSAWLKSQVIRTIDTSIVADRGNNNEYPNSISLKGGVLVLGAQKANSDMGAVYIFKDQSGTFVQDKKISGTVSSGQFGASVSTDGSKIAIGAPGDFGTRGVVYIVDANSYSISDSISSPGPIHGAFGLAVALSGSLLAVGAPGEDLYKDSVKGNLYTYSYSTSWSPVGNALSNSTTKSAMAVTTQTNVAATVTLNDGAELGNSISIYNGRILVGAPGYVNNSNVVGIAFLLSADLNSMQSLQNVSNNSARFGQSVAMGSQGIVISLPEIDGKMGAIDHFTNAGSYFQFNRRVTSTYRALSDEFGSSVAASGDYFAIGARNKGPNHTEGSVSIITPVIP